MSIELRNFFKTINSEFLSSINISSQKSRNSSVCVFFFCKTSFAKSHNPLEKKFDGTLPYLVCEIGGRKKKKKEKKLVGRLGHLAPTAR